MQYLPLPTPATKTPAAKLQRWLAIGGIALASLGLAACGGGGGGSSAPPVTPPPVTPPPVQTAPTIGTPPSATSVEAGQSASFSVVASGSGTLSYQWFRGAAAISGATLATYTTAVLSLADSGATFSVVVTGSGGTVTSPTATLTVTAPAVTTLVPRLLAHPGPTLETSFNGAYTPSANTGALTVFSNTGSSGATVLANPGTWFPQGSLMQADVDVAGGVVRNLREAARLFIQSGQLKKIDLEAPGTPAPVRVSTLDVSDVCATGESPIGERFDDWTQPANAVLVYQAQPACENGITPLGDRRYVAVRAGMSSTTAPIALGAFRPLMALRNEAGSLTGFIVYDGSTLARVDTAFANASVITANAAVRDDVIRVLGVYGPANAPYLLYSYQPFAQATQLRRVELTGPATQSTLLSVASVYSVTSDAEAVYVLGPVVDGSEVQLYRVGHDQSVRTLATRVNSDGTESRLRLSASRCLVVTRNAVTSIPLGAGSRELYLATGLQIDKAEVLGEDLYLQVRDGTSGTFYDATIKLMATDLSNVVDMPKTLMLAPLMQAAQPLVRRDHAAVTWAAIMLARADDPRGVFAFANATLLTYLPGRVSNVRGVFPDIGADNGPQVVPDLDGSGGYLNWVSARYLSAYHLGQNGLVTAESGDTVFVPGASGPLLQLTAYP
jgi:hypothetical protein